MLEDWVRINQLDSGNILEGLKRIIQATQLLQVKSTLDDVGGTLSSHRFCSIFILTVYHQHPNVAA